MSNWLRPTHAADGAALLLAIGIGAGFGYGMASPSTAASLSHSPLTSTTKRPPVAMTVLEELRQSSLLGDADASTELATRLLDRYDFDGDDDDLFEAVVWIDRNLYAAQSVAFAKRFSSHYCGHHVLQWHALCLPGE